MTWEECKHEQKVTKAAAGLEVRESDRYSAEDEHTCLL